MVGDLRYIITAGSRGRSGRRGGVEIGVIGSRAAAASPRGSDDGAGGRESFHNRSENSYASPQWAYASNPCFRRAEGVLQNEMVKYQGSRAGLLLLLAGCFIAGGASVLAQAQTSSKTPLEHVVAPGGKVVFYIMSLPGKDSMGNPRSAIEAGINENSSFRILLASTPSNDPKANLTDFSHLSLSPDGKTLYFQTSAWATSAAIHSLDIATKKTSFVTSGEIACVVFRGRIPRRFGCGTTQVFYTRRQLRRSLFV
jgi:hypothetical protein